MARGIHSIRADVLYSRVGPQGRGRTQISAELPLIYATGRRGEPHRRDPGEESLIRIDRSHTLVSAENEAGFTRVPSASRIEPPRQRFHDAAHRSY
jgi:hypothetical protein